jgi:U3 small nucleolar RNA-associated protein 14
MDQTLAYLHEILSNYTEKQEVIRNIDHKIEQNHYSSEGSFVRGLSEEEIRSLEQILQEEIKHANESGDLERGYQLNEVFELLY